jgi:hypothetical protein
MSARLIGIILVLAFCSACQMGKIPCPKNKEARVRKHFRPSASMLSAKADREPETPRPSPKNSDPRFVKNVSVEEWDCPKPGAKKYKPKAVKDNIRKNMNKINSDQQKQNQTESLSQ